MGTARTGRRCYTLWEMAANGEILPTIFHHTQQWPIFITPQSEAGFVRRSVQHWWNEYGRRQGETQAPATQLLTRKA